MFGYDRLQSSFAELFTERIESFGHAVRVSYQQVAATQVDSLLFITAVLEQPNDRTTFVKTKAFRFHALARVCRNGLHSRMFIQITLRAKDERWVVSGIHVSQLARLFVVLRIEEGDVGSFARRVTEQAVDA